jgi:glyoxylase-like metal-dependent hydrolase (beta-lactamase superfamily II)
MPAHWNGADAVLLSHLHHDHAGLRSLRLLPPLLRSSRGSERCVAAQAQPRRRAPADGEWIGVGR